MAAAASVYLSRNVVIALLSLHSWKTLMKNWLMDYASIIDVKASSTLSDRISKAANKILKVFCCVLYLLVNTLLN